MMIIIMMIVFVREELVAALRELEDAFGEKVDEGGGEDDAERDAGEDLDDEVDATLLALARVLVVVVGDGAVREGDRSSGADHASEEDDEDGEDLEVADGKRIRFVIVISRAHFIYYKKLLKFKVFFKKIVIF